MNNPPEPELLTSSPKPARRPHRSLDQWADLVAQHAASGLDVATFCAQHDVGVAGFYAWRRRLASPEPAPADVDLPRFVRLASTPVANVALTADFPGDVRLTAPVSSLSDLVAALRSPVRC